jgi:cell division protease FtsH
VAFLNLSGSDFVEMFVGVGAARVRDLFKQAQDQAPCIIFVDELDAIGKARSANNLHGNDEREQTLNAMLVEMDGFDSRAGVILLAATNRPEILDRALLRPGRFDRQVVVDAPDVRGREAILKVHARAVKAADEVDLQKIAAQTPGFVGADLANVVNEAALLAARQGRDAVYMEHFQEAIERVMAGVEKPSRRISVHEKNIVAYHEAGHAIVAKAVKHADPVHKVSIVSRGMAALGYTLQVPIEDRYLMTKAELEDRISVLLGGRAAEQIIFRDVSTGASNDLQRVSSIARSMVLDYGMSLKIGTLSLGDRGGSSEQLISQRPYSEQTAEVIDQEVRELVEHHYRRALTVLEQNIDVLHAMADKLKEDEVLDGAALAELLDRVHFDEPTSTSRDGHL